jgi:hypothetical protein
MLVDIRYRGGFLTDTSIPGERKSDRVIPAHGNGALRASHRRWIVFASTLDPSGWDAVKSIIYQIRSDAPDGPVLNEGLVCPAISGWDPLNEGATLRKVHGMPMAFGTPKGALRDGLPIPGANVFVVKWYRRPLLELNGHLYQSHQHLDIWPDGPSMNPRLLRVEWMQFRLNDAEDDIEILQPPQQLRQQGYEEGEAFCSHGPGCFMNHAMTPPVPDEGDIDWISCESFKGTEASGHKTHGQFAPVRYRWDSDSGLYQWTETGPLTSVEGRALGETSISRVDDHWIVAARSFTKDGSTFWYRSTNPFESLGEPIARMGDWGPRHSYRCADGQLRLFYSDKDPDPDLGSRNPLRVVDVDPQTCAYSEPRVIVDLKKAGLPFHHPFADMAKLCPPHNGRQTLIFRTIDRQMTADPATGDPSLSDTAFAAAGIHYADLTYDAMEETWAF